MTPLSQYLGSQVPRLSEQRRPRPQRPSRPPRPRRRLAGALLLLILALVAVPAGASASTSAGPVDHFDVRLSTKPQTDAEWTVSIIARDAANALVTGYSAPAHLSDSAGQFGTPAGPFVEGVSKTTFVTTVPVRGDRFTATADTIQGKSAVFNVVGPADHLALSAPSSVAAGAGFKVLARALDAAGNLATGYSGPAQWTDSAGRLSPSAPADFQAGVSNTSAQTSAPVHNDVITLTSGQLTAKRTLNAIGPFDHLDTRVPAWVPLDGSFTLTAYARDAANNLVRTYEGGWDWDGTGSAGGSMAPFVGGISKTTISGSAWDAPQHQLRLILTSGACCVVTSPIDIVGPVDHFALTWKRTDGLTGCESVTGSVLAKAVDSAGNLVRSYNETNLYWGPDRSDVVLRGTSDPAAPAPFVNGVSWNPRMSWSGVFPIEPTGVHLDISVGLFQGGTTFGQVVVC